MYIIDSSFLMTTYYSDMFYFVIRSQVTTLAVLAQPVSFSFLGWNWTVRAIDAKNSQYCFGATCYPSPGCQLSHLDVRPSSMQGLRRGSGPETASTNRTG